MKISAVAKDGVANELGVQAGDVLLAFDGHRVIDVLDYDFYNAAERFVMTVRRGDEVTDYEIEKDEDEDLGLELSRDIPVRNCCNRCIFCFVDQLPKADLRQTLRVKDDDYRHSFIFGNYVTLTNVSDTELRRIVRLHLSPLYVSVHASDPELRRRMLGCPKAPDIMRQLEILHEGGIAVHAQVVFCPGYNDDLDKIIADVEPYTASLAIVPVGLTRGHNPALRPVEADDARKVVACVERWQSKFLKARGTRYVFAADEFYCKAGLPVPPYEAYENFAQIENGVGLIAQFLHDFDAALCGAEDGKIGNCSVATGVSAYPLIEDCAQKLTARFGGSVRVHCIENDFFGHTVTVAGLVTGGDLIAQLKGKELGDRLLLPSVMLREFGDVFLDNVTVRQVSEALGVPVCIVPPDGESFVSAFLGKENG